MYDPRFVRGAVFNAPGIKDSWSWISGKLEHRLAAENSKILSKEFYTNDADSRVTILEHKIQLGVCIIIQIHSGLMQLMVQEHIQVETFLVKNIVVR